MPIDARIPLMAQAPQQQNPLNMLMQMMQYKQAMEKNKLLGLESKRAEQLHPYAIESAKAKAEEARVMAGIFSKGLAQSGGNALAGGQGAENPLALPQDIQLQLMHPRLKDLGKENAKRVALSTKMRELISAGIKPGSPQWNAALTQVATQGGIWELGPNGERTLPKGFAEGQGQIKGAEEKAKLNAAAEYKIVNVPSTGPNQPPVEMTQAQRLKILNPQQQDSPLIAKLKANGYTDAELKKVRELENSSPPQIPMNNGSTEQQPMGSIPTSSVVGHPTGMSPNALIENARKKEWEVGSTKENLKFYQKLQVDSRNIQPKIAKIERIGKLLGDYDGGKLAGAGFELSRLGTSLGIKVDGLSNKEAAEALSKEIALELRQTGEGTGMPGNMSDSDREYLRSITPQLAQTSEGRRKVIENRVKVWKRDQKIAEMARLYVKKHGAMDDDFFGQLQDWSNRNPIFNAN